MLHQGCFGENARQKLLKCYFPLVIIVVVLTVAVAQFQLLVDLAADLPDLQQQGAHHGHGVVGRLLRVALRHLVVAEKHGVQRLPEQHKVALRQRWYLALEIQTKVREDFTITDRRGPYSPG